MISICDRNIKIEGRWIRIARPDGDSYRVLEHPELVVEGLGRCGTRVDLFTFSQGLSETTPTLSFPMEWDNWAVVPVSTFDHWWRKQANDRVRNKVRKAEKNGVVVRAVPFDDTLVQGIWEIYNECPVRQGRAFRHYGKDLKTVYAEEATHLDRSVFLCAFLDNQMIGFVKMLVNDARTQAKTMNVISMIRHWNKGTMNALIAHAVQFCADREIPHLVYGTYTYGKKQQDSVSSFKRANGFRRIDLPRYYVPLTRFGRLAFRLGLHHGGVTYLPESVMARLRGLRKAWNDRKVQAVRTG